MNKGIKWIPAKNVVPWDRTNRNLPLGEGLQKWIHYNYFGQADLSSLFDQVGTLTPKGNTFNYSINVKVESDPLWKDLDWSSVNYVASTIKLSKYQKGYAYFHVINMTPRYMSRKDGSTFIVCTYELELDEWCTYYDNFVEGFHGKFQMSQGHKHEWREEKDTNGKLLGYVPDFDNNQGISMCDEVCGKFDDKSVISEIESLDSPSEDYLALFFSSSRGDWTKAVSHGNNSGDITKDIYTSMEALGIYSGFDKSETIFEDENGNLSIIPYYVIFIKKENVSARLITAIIDILGITPMDNDGAMGVWSALNNNTKFVTNDGKHYPQDINNTYWQALYKALNNDGYKVYGIDGQTGEGSISVLSFGANLKIQQVIEISLPSDWESKRKYNWQYMLLPAGFGSHWMNQVNNDISIIYPEMILKKVFLPIREQRDESNKYYITYINDEVEWESEEDSEEYGVDENRHEIDTYSKILNGKIYQKDEIIKDKITPHLLTSNHYTENILSVNQEVKQFDVKDYYYMANHNFVISITGRPLLNADRAGWKYYIKPSWMKQGVNALSKEYVIDTVDSNIIPYSDNQYNDFMRANVNALQTGRENARATFSTEKKIAERNYKQQMFSNIFGGVAKMASNVATFGYAGMAENIINAGTTAGQMAMNKAEGNMTQSAIGAESSAGGMAGGIWGAINAKKNAIDRARTSEQNSLRSIQGKVDDARNSQVNEANVNSSNTLSKFLDLVEADNTKYGINSIAKYTATIPDNQKDIVWYMRNIYGDGFIKTMDVKSIYELMVRHYFSTMRLRDIEPIINKMMLPTSIKETFKETLTNVTSFWNIMWLTKDSMMNYEVNNYDNILDDLDLRKYMLNAKLTNKLGGTK